MPLSSRTSFLIRSSMSVMRNMYISSKLLFRAISIIISGRRGCYSPSEKDVNVAVSKIRVETAPTGRRRAVVFRQGVVRIPVNIIIIAAVAKAVGHRSPHHCLLHYPVLIVVPPIRCRSFDRVSSRSSQITLEHGL